jgi:hypothetical protein
MTFTFFTSALLSVGCTAAARIIHQGICDMRATRATRTTMGRRIGVPDCESFFS